MLLKNRCLKMSGEPNQEKAKQALLELVRQTLERDKALREKFGVGDKFRFIKDRLQALLDQVEKYVVVQQIAAKRAIKTVGEDEMLAYVYLYNTQGATLQTWANMLTPKLLYEYSVNRPIYADQKFVESVIHSKSNPMQHAYFTIIIKKDAVVSHEVPQLDANQHPVIKVKEGALKFEKLLVFCHNHLNYEFEESRFIKI
jgi:hypothetical protein